MRLPASVIGGHLQMIAVLQAEESLRRVTEIAAGNGLIPAPERTRILAAWRRQAQKMGRQRRQTLAELAAPGLPIVEVSKSA
tara:strand:+ start:1366 stop:1611 length:246 start_codon:yes stop_codon:yes gene_type:complete